MKIQFGGLWEELERDLKREWLDIRAEFKDGVGQKSVKKALRGLLKETLRLVGSGDDVRARVRAERNIVHIQGTLVSLSVVEQVRLWMRLRRMVKRVLYGVLERVVG